MRRLVPSLLAFALVLTAAAPALADSRPTSGDMSLFSGRTLGNGETALAAGLGWPGLWAGLWLAPSSKFNLGFRGHVLYASPIMGLSTGIGGSFSVPIRLHLFGTGALDLSIMVEPAFSAGSGSLAGEDGTFSDDFGFAIHGTTAGLAGAQISEAVTLILGLGGDVAFVSVPDGDTAQLVGGIIAILGVEALMARDTMLFLELRGGVGFRPDDLFSGPEIVRGSLGVAYLL